MDASQMLPRCFPSSPLTSEASQVPTPRFQEWKNNMWFLLLEIDMQNRRKKLSESMLFWALFRAGFHRKSCACGLLVRMPFLVIFQRFSWRPDPRSARAGAVETQFLHLRVNAYQMYFGHHFLHIFWHFDLIFFARSTCKNNGEKNTNCHRIWVPKRVPEKWFFEVFLVPDFEGAPG